MQFQASLNDSLSTINASMPTNGLMTDQQLINDLKKDMRKKEQEFVK